MIPGSVISKLNRIGLDEDQFDAIVALLEEVSDAVEAKAGAAIAARRASDRERKQRQRGGTVSRDITGRHGTDRDPPKEGPQTPKETTPNTSLRSEAIEAREAFPKFKAAFPKKPGHQWAPAEAKFLALAKGGVPPADMIAGAERYARFRAGDDPQFTKAPLVFLNQRGWLEDWTPAARPMNARARAGPFPSASPEKFNAQRGMEKFLERLDQHRDSPFADPHRDEPEIIPPARSFAR